MALPASFFDFAQRCPVECVPVGAAATGSLPLVYRLDPSAPSLAVAFCIRAGVAYESPADWGASHFLEHILMRGTEKYPSLYDLARQVEGLGGQNSAYSTRDLAVYWVKLPPGQDRLAVDILTQILFHPVIKQKYIDAERLIVAQERQRERTNPSAYTSLAMEGLLLEPSPISRHPVGEDAFLEGLTPGYLYNFLGQYYHRDNLSVAAAGCLSSNFVELLGEALRPIRGGNQAVEAEFEVPAHLDAQHSVARRVSPHKQQVFVALGWRVPIVNRQELITWRVINTLLGSGYTSLLNQRLRERESLTYVCQTSFNAYGDYGVLKLHMALVDRDLPKAIEQVEEIIAEVAELKVSPIIFAEAKVRHAAGLVFRHENPFEIVRLLGHTYAREGQVFSLVDYLQQTAQVELENAANLAKQYLSPSQRFLLLYSGSPMVPQLYPDAVELP